MPHPRPDTSVVKRCSRCKETLPRENFSPSKGTFDLLAPYCRPCNNARQRERREKIGWTPEYRAKNAQRAKDWREKNPRLSKDHKLKSTYGLEIGQYDKMLEAQDGKCAICRTSEPNKRGHDFSVDHCHETNAIRGLLCSNCNVGIGHFFHREDLLFLAIGYLRLHQPKVLV